MTRTRMFLAVNYACRVIGEQYRFEKEVARRLAAYHAEREEKALALEAAGQ